MEIPAPDTIRASAVIIALPGRRRDSLKVVTDACDKLGFVGVVDDWAAGSKLIAELAPMLVVVDSDGLDEPVFLQILKQLKAEYPQVSCCVAVNTQEHACQARIAGAEIVLQTGFSANTFFDAIAALAKRKNAERVHPILLEGGILSDDQTDEIPETENPVDAQSAASSQEVSPKLAV